MVNAKCKSRNAAASWNRRRFFRNLLLIAAGALLLSIVGVSLLVFLASLAISVAMSRIPGLKKVI